MKQVLFWIVFALTAAPMAVVALLYVIAQTMMWQKVTGVFDFLVRVLMKFQAWCES